jgi:hypothetical protein
VSPSSFINGLTCLSPDVTHYLHEYGHRKSEGHQLLPDDGSVPFVLVTPSQNWDLEEIAGRGTSVEI